jgi:hypothetical protein
MSKFKSLLNQTGFSKKIFDFGISGNSKSIPTPEIPKVEVPPIPQEVVDNTPPSIALGGDSSLVVGPGAAKDTVKNQRVSGRSPKRKPVKTDILGGLGQSGLNI